MFASFSRSFAALALAPALLATAAAAEPVSVPLDGETTVGGVPVACTGVGQTKLDPRWTAYPVRVEFSDAHDAYLADEAVRVWDSKGRPVLSVQCAGPWILLKPAPGSYRIEGRLLNATAKPRTAPFKPPSRGQLRLVLKFPDA